MIYYDVITGGAFGSVVNSLVNDMIMPPIGWLLSGVDFANIFVLLKRGKKNMITRGVYKSLAQAKDDGAVTVNIGVFLNSVLNFVVISVIIFTFVRTINRVKTDSEKEHHCANKKRCPYCFSKIDRRATRCSLCTSDISSSTAEADFLEEVEYKEGKGSAKILKKNLKKQLSRNGSFK